MERRDFMLSTEQGVIPGSDFYIHTPSAQASAMFLYPVSTGYFRYLPGYCLRRSSYDSFLIMYMQKGSCEIETGGGSVMPGRTRLSCWTAMNLTATIPPLDGMQNGCILTVPMPAAILKQSWTAGIL